MDFLSNMNSALDYIESHLTEEIDTKELAQAAGCSVYTFQRFFTYVSGLSLTEYIRKRRLSNAALELRQSNIKIIDLAVKYGYESANSFSRAFQTLHGVTPAAARKGGILKSFPRLYLNFSLKGDTAMDYRIVTKAAFRMLGVKETVSKLNDENLKRLPELWRTHYKERDELLALSGNNLRDIYGVTMYITDDAFDYYVATITDQPTRGTMTEIIIPETTWAIFPCVGPLPDAQYNLWRRIFTEWLPISGYCLAEPPEIERYSEGNIESVDYESEIWLPVKRNHF